MKVPVFDVVDHPSSKKTLMGANPKMPREAKSKVDGNQPMPKLRKLKRPVVDKLEVQEKLAAKNQDQLNPPGLPNTEKLKNALAENTVNFDPETRNVLGRILEEKT